MARVDLRELGERLARGDVDGALRLADPAGLADALAVRLPPTDDLLAAGCPLLAQGIAAGIGVASGGLVLTARDAAERGANEPLILVQRETGGEDIAGVRVVRALVEASGGLTSEGAVMARGLGLPCVVGATTMRIDAREGRLFASDRDGVAAPREVRTGARVTVCGTTGRIVLGEATGAPAADQPVLVALLKAADSRRRIKIVALTRSRNDEELATVSGADGRVGDGAPVERLADVIAAVQGATREVIVAPGRVAVARLVAARATLPPMPPPP